MIGPVPLNPQVSKLLAKNQDRRRSGRKNSHRAAAEDPQIAHRLMYLNPRERARRDLENRHGDNMTKLTQAFAERLNSTLESQIKNLGASLGRSNTKSNLLHSPPGGGGGSGLRPPRAGQK